MTPRLTGSELVSRANRALSQTMLIANTAGALIVFVFLTFVLPMKHPTPIGTALKINLPVLAAVAAAGVFLAPRAGRVIALRRLAWLLEDRAPTAEEQRRALRNAYAQVKLVCAFWAGSAVVFGSVNTVFSAQVGSEVAAGIVMGGLVTAAICYLLSERALRPLTARALEWGVPMRPVAPGVIARTVLAWALASGVPVLAIADVALGMIDGNAPLSKATAGSVVFLAVAGLAVGAVAIVFAAKSVAEPIRAVREALAQVEAGATDVSVPVDDASEVGLLQAGFNRMVLGLAERERLRDLFGRHVGEDVARRALEAGVELGGEVREAAVLFVDVIGSTRAATELPPQAVVGQLNTFFGVVQETIRAHGGWLNKFEGDAALCIFGVPTPLDSPATCALAAARELSVRLRAESPFPAAIGVSAGEVVAGNVGTPERFEYTVIGDPVNEASRLSELAKERESRLVASGRALGRASAKEAECWEIDGEATLRGRSEATVLVTPLRARVTAG